MFPSVFKLYEILKALHCNNLPPVIRAVEAVVYTGLSTQCVRQHSCPICTIASNFVNTGGSVMEVSFNYGFLMWTK